VSRTLYLGGVDVYIGNFQEEFCHITNGKNEREREREGERERERTRIVARSALVKRIESLA
jgi:hypothetical protein